MLLAGLTGFLNADADNMKAEVAAKRKAEADALANITGWRKKVAENAMKNSSEQENILLKAKLDGKISLTDQFGIASSKNKEYTENWNPTMGAFDIPNKDLSKFAKIISDTDKYKTFIKNSKGETVYKSTVDTTNLTLGHSTAWLAELGGKLKTQEFVNELRGMDNTAFRDISSKYNVSLMALLNDAKEKKVDMGSIDINKLFSFDVIDELASARNQPLTVLSDVTASQDAALSGGKIITFDVDPKSENDKIGSSKFLTAINATPKNAAHVWSDQYTLSSQTSESKQSSLIMSKGLFKNENVNIEALDPNGGLNYTSIFTTKENVMRYWNHIETSAKKAGLKADDHLGKILALSAGMTTEKEYVNPVLDDNPFRKKPERSVAIKSYAIDSVFGIDDPDKANKKFDDIKTESEFSDNVFTTLTQYRQARSKVKGVVSVESIMTKIGIALNTDDGVLGTIINRFNLGTSELAKSKVIKVNDITESTEGTNDTATNKKELTSNYVKSIEANITNQTNDELAKLEALRISLAFMLARQADPSGRLSNQDIDQQLRRLGGTGISTSGMDLVKIDLLLAETKRKRDKYSTIITIADTNTKASDTSKRVIDAAIAYDRLNDKYSMYEARGEADSSAGGMPDFNEENSWSVPKYQSSKGEAITVHEDSDGRQRYFVGVQSGNPVEIGENQLVEKSNIGPSAFPQNNNQEVKNESKENIADENSLVIVRSDSTGIVLGDKQADGTVIERPGKYRQNPNNFNFDRIK